MRPIPSALVVLATVSAAVLGACGRDGEVRHFAIGDRSIKAHVGDVLAIDLPSSPPGRACWTVSAEDERLAQLRDVLTAAPGVKQVERRDPAQPLDDRWSDGSDLEVFLNLDVRDDQRRHVEELLTGQADVGADGVVYVSQQEQFELFTEYFRDQPEYLENVVAADLPSSFKVKVRSLDRRIVAPHASTSHTTGDEQSLRFRVKRAGATDIVLEQSCSSGDVGSDVLDVAVVASE
jgi:FtsX extracellular domain